MRPEVRFAVRSEPTRLQVMGQRFYALIFVRSPDFVEVGLGMLMLLWGIQLLMPWETFDTGRGYDAMAALLPEPVWGGLLAWVGFTQVGAYLLDHRRVRVASSLGACMAWMFLAVLFGVSNPLGTGWIVYGAFVFFTAWVFWRVLTGRYS